MSKVKKNVPFDVFLFLARHSRITNWVEYAAVIEAKYPQLISAFGKLKVRQIAKLDKILIDKRLAEQGREGKEQEAAKNEQSRRIV